MNNLNVLATNQKKANIQRCYFYEIRFFFHYKHFYIKKIDFLVFF